MSKGKKQKDKEQPQTWFEKVKPFLEVLVAATAVVSLVLSIKGCRNAQKANATAADALETSRHQFIQLNRPYITLRPKKYGDGKYWKLAQQGTSVVIDLQYEVKNIGNVAAKDVNLPDKVLATSNKKSVPAVYRKPVPVTLGPGESFVAGVHTQEFYETLDAAKKNVQHHLSTESEGVFLHLSVEYANEVDKSQTYRTVVTTRIHNDRAQLIRSDMLSLAEEADETKSNNKPTP